MQAEIKKFLDKNLLNILGGCCGTTPEHLKELVAIAKEYQPRPLTLGN